MTAPLPHDGWMHPDEHHWQRGPWYISCAPGVDEKLYTLWWLSGPRRRMHTPPFRDLAEAKAKVRELEVERAAAKASA